MCDWCRKLGGDSAEGGRRDRGQERVIKVCCRSALCPLLDWDVTAVHSGPRGADKGGGRGSAATSAAFDCRADRVVCFVSQGIIGY